MTDSGNAEYRALCDKYARAERQLLQLDKIAHAVPIKLRDALARHLKVENKAAESPSRKFGVPVGYVDLFRQAPSRHGEVNWLPCEPDHALQQPPDRLAFFTLGLTLADSATLHGQSKTLLMNLTVSKVTEEQVALSIGGNLGELLTIQPHSQNSYGDAALKLIDWLTAAIDKREPLPYLH